MKFFAILKEGEFASRIMRFKLDQSAEKLMKDVILNALNEFESKIDTEVPFSADYKPSNNEIFIIEKFNSIIDISIIKSNPTGIPELELQSNSNQNCVSLDDVVGIISTDYESNRFLIQYFEKRNIINLSNTLIQRILNNSYEFVAASSIGISLPTELTAIIDNQSTLKFKSFQRLRHIFNMDFYFREATEQELETFVNNCSKFDLIQGFDIKQIDDTNIRKKITIINKSGVLDNYTVEQLKDAAVSIGYPIPLNTEGNKIQLPNSKKEFKDLLQFLSSNIYEDPISHQTRITNSSRPYNS